MKKYRTEKYNTKIVEVECVRETAKRAVILEPVFRLLAGSDGVQERSVHKISEYTRYHDSWDEARDYLLARTEKRIERAESLLNEARAEREAVHELKRP